MNNKDRDQYLALLQQGGGFGIEKEGMRVTPEGDLAQTPHPFSGDPNIGRDFCEDQIEIVTPVCHSIEELEQSLKQLQEKVLNTLKALPSGEELLWPFSNPAHIHSEEEIPVAVFSGDMKSKTEYREYLVEKYGKTLMTLSGIHFNYSYPEPFLRALYEDTGKNGDFRNFCDGVYLRLAEKVIRNSWLIVLLTAASPISDPSYWRFGRPRKAAAEDYSSIRSSEDGYWNDFEPVFEYENLDRYIASVRKYVDNGQLVSPKELYYPVRLKPEGVNSLEALEKDGVDHIEIRAIDLNPLSPIGMMREDMEFLHRMIIWMTLTPEIRLDEEMQRKSIEKMQLAAHLEVPEAMIAEGIALLQEMETFFPGDGSIAFQMNKLLHPGSRYDYLVKERFENGYIEKGLALARTYAKGESR